MDRIINLSILTIFFALSFLVITDLPNYIIDTSLEILVYVIWFLGFSVAYIKAGLER